MQTFLSHDIRFFLTYCDYGMFIGVRNFVCVHIYSTLKIIVDICDYLDCQLLQLSQNWTVLLSMSIDSGGELFYLITSDFSDIL